MKILNNYQLKNNNTFGVNAIADKFIEYSNDDQIIDFITKNKKEILSGFFVIGEGSNLLFTEDYKGIVIHPKSENINVISEDFDSIYVEASAGLIFCDFIKWTIENKAFGLENLSHIPGTVGASAVQNVGAYGAEASEYIFEVKYLEVETGETKVLKNRECNFEYRNSIFKNKLKNKIIVLSVTYKLNKIFSPNLKYADVRKYFEHENIADITAGAVRDAVIQIRNSKLPDPKKIGNAGSFFKNPVISKDKFVLIREKFPDVRYYDHNNDMIKLAAGWLIDKCGLKGFEHNGAAVHENQALVLINKNNTTGRSILELSEIVRKKIFDTFDVVLEPEVIII